MPTTHRMRLLNVGAVLTAVLSLAAVIGVAACEPTPPPPPPPPPPPTTAAPKYEHCGDPALNLTAFRCGVYAYGYPQAMTTTATGVAATTEPPTTIFMRLSLETYNPADGSWVSGNWVNQTSGMSVQSLTYNTVPVGCRHGLYRWKIDVSFKGNSTTYWAVSNSVTI